MTRHFLSVYVIHAYAKQVAPVNEAADHRPACEKSADKSGLLWANGAQNERPSVNQTTR